MGEICPHGRNKDDCLLCWADFNVELERLRIEAGLTRGEFEKLIRDSIRKGEAMVNKHRPPMTKEDKKLWRMVKQLSPEDFVRWQKEWAGIFVSVLSKSKTPEELIPQRDKMLTSFRAVPVIAAELKKKFHEAILEKRKSPFKAIKGGRRQKRIKQNLKGEFNL